MVVARAGRYEPLEAAEEEDGALLRLGLDLWRQRLAVVVVAARRWPQRAAANMARREATVTIANAAASRAAADRRMVVVVVMMPLHEWPDVAAVAEEAAAQEASESPRPQIEDEERPSSAHRAEG